MEVKKRRGVFCISLYKRKEYFVVGLKEKRLCASLSEGESGMSKGNEVFCKNREGDNIHLYEMKMRYFTFILKGKEC